MKKITLEDVSIPKSSNIAQKDLENNNGIYPIYGASGLIKKVDFYKFDTDYIAIVKDGAGVGRVMKLPAKSSIIGTMQGIIPNERIDINYLYYFLISKKLERYHTGATIPHIYYKNYKNEKIELIEIEEQKYRANKLNYVQNIIKLKENQLKELERLLKSQFVEMFGDPIENPKNNEIVKLSDIAEYWNGLTYKPTDVNKEGTIVLRSSNIQNSQLNYEDIVRVNCNIKEKQYVKDNDILMCSRNGSARLVGKVAVIKDAKERMTFGAFMMIIRSKYYPYLFSYFQTDAFRNQIKSGATTTINQITGNMLNKIKLPLPNMKDIEQFAEIVKQIDKQKFEIENSLKDMQELYESLMERYFG